jgi:Holliday junction resolvasome RuvABC endonuclease subunit
VSCLLEMLREPIVDRNASGDRYVLFWHQLFMHCHQTLKKCTAIKQLFMHLHTTSTTTQAQARTAAAAAIPAEASRRS